MAVPSATDRKNNATIWVRNAPGASFVDRDRHTGDSSSSATVKTSRMPVRPSSGTLCGPPPANGRNSRNATPITIVPRPNLTAGDGGGGASQVHSAAKTPDRTMMKIGLIDWTQDTGIVQPNRSRSSRLSEYTVTTVNCCWYSDQNAALVMNIGMKAITRRRSVRSIRLLERITVK